MTETKSVTITAKPENFTLDLSQLGDGFEGVAYGPFEAKASGGQEPYSYTLKAPEELGLEGLPEGLVANGDEISGTPSVSGDFPVKVTVKDAEGFETEVTLTLHVTIAPEL
ncbi:putative Ig domain-containing protein, partial [Brucella intermedia]|uniref:putative Ig domain-containing protein n=1 Tax=Brucella intermedia TaxID=94625 RepID=UPI003F173E6F